MRRTVETEMMRMICMRLAEGSPLNEKRKRAIAQGECPTLEDVLELSDSVLLLNDLSLTLRYAGRLATDSPSSIHALAAVEDPAALLSSDMRAVPRRSYRGASDPVAIRRGVERIQAED